MQLGMDGRRRDGKEREGPGKRMRKE